MLRFQAIFFFVMIGLILLNSWIFTTLFGLNYLHWYIQSGTLVGAGITFVSLASKDFKNNVDAISANPGIYFAAYD